MSRITLVTRGDDQVVEQIEKQLNKLIGVIQVSISPKPAMSNVRWRSSR